QMRNDLMQIMVFHSSQALTPCSMLASFRLTHQDKCSSPNGSKHQNAPSMVAWDVTCPSPRQRELQNTYAITTQHSPPITSERENHPPVSLLVLIDARRV